MNLFSSASIDNAPRRRSPRLQSTPSTSIPPSSRVTEDRRIVKEEKEKSSKGSHYYDFGGPIGCLFLIIFLPLVSLFFAVACQDKIKCIRYDELKSFINVIPPFVFSFKPFASFRCASYSSWWPSLPNVWNMEAQIIVVGYLIAQAILYIIIPGEIVEGLEIKKLGGAKLKYKLNGHTQFVITLLLLSIGYPVFNFKERKFLGMKSYPLHHLYDMYIPLITSCILTSFFFSLFLYIYSFRRNDTKINKTEERRESLSSSSNTNKYDKHESIRNKVILSDTGNTGNIFVDFFMGRELNPRIVHKLLDLKVFLDLRPPLIGWTILNICYISKEMHMKNYASLPLILLTIFQGIYTYDALIFESAILSSMDITTEGLGFMLVFGDIVWVPFMYSLQGRYLVHSTPNFCCFTLLFFSLIFFLGYWIFRSSNLEKHRFRTNPNDQSVAHLKYITTKNGRKLLISGWWGAARKINYLGDMIIGLAFCLLTGWSSPIPFFYFPYIICLLAHRAWRDDRECAKKYGEDWIRYKRHVNSLFIPYIF